MDIIVDVETLGLTPNAYVLSLGYALFDLKATTIICAEEFVLSKEANRNREFDVDVLKWWSEEENRNKILMSYLNETHTYDLYFLEKFFSKTFEESSTIWCRGLDFDIPILKTLIPNAFKGNSRKKFRDLRTALAFQKDFPFVNCSYKPYEIPIYTESALQENTSTSSIRNQRHSAKYDCLQDVSYLFRVLSDNK